MTIARPSATSATVMQIANSVNTMPASSPWERLKATKLMLTAFSMSSTPSRIPIVLRRVTVPNRPRQKTTAASVRYACRPMLVLRPREVARAEQADEQQHREQLEREHVARQQRRPELPREIAGERRPRHVHTRLRDRAHEQREQAQRDDGARANPAVRLREPLADQP